MKKLVFALVVILAACASKKDEPRYSPFSDKDQVKAGIYKKLPLIQECYNAEIANHKDLQGEILVNIEIRPDGTVKEAVVKNSTLRNSNVENCTLKILKETQFAALTSEENFLIEYPFTFNPIRRIKTESSVQDKTTGKSSKKQKEPK